MYLYVTRICFKWQWQIDENAFFVNQSLFNFKSSSELFSIQFYINYVIQYHLKVRNQCCVGSRDFVTSIWLGSRLSWRWTRRFPRKVVESNIIYHIFFFLALYSSIRVAKTKLHTRTKSIDLHLKLLSIEYSNYSVKYNQSHAL